MIVCVRCTLPSTGIYTVHCVSALLRTVGTASRCLSTHNYWAYGFSTLRLQLICCSGKGYVRCYYCNKTCDFCCCCLTARYYAASIAVATCCYSEENCNLWPARNCCYFDCSCHDCYIVVLIVLTVSCRHIPERPSATRAFSRASVVGLLSYTSVCVCGIAVDLNLWLLLARCAAT